MTDRPDPWGPYRSTIEEHLDSCTDYLDRLRRSLAGEIAPDRCYFADKARQLHAAARRMDRTAQDIDGWLGDCGATVAYDRPDGTLFVADCTLPAGHNGPHQDGSVHLAGGRLVGELRDLADAVERTGHNFAWRAPDLDRDIAGAPATTGRGQDILLDLAASLDTIRRRTAKLTADVRDVCVGLAEESLSGPDVDDGRGVGTDQSLSVD